MTVFVHGGGCQGVGGGGKGEACDGQHEWQSAPSFERGVTDRGGAGGAAAARDYCYWEDGAAASSER